MLCEKINIGGIVFEVIKISKHKEEYEVKVFQDSKEFYIEIPERIYETEMGCYYAIVRYLEELTVEGVRK